MAKAVKQIKNMIETIHIDALMPNPYNSNKMPEAKFEALVDTIRRNGQTHPIQAVETEIKGKYRIMGGEHKWRAMKLLGYQECMVIVRAFEDTIDEELGSIEDNLHGNTVPIKEALIIAKAIEKYPMSKLQKMLGDTQGEIKDKLILAGQEQTLEDIRAQLSTEHTVTVQFVLDAKPQENAEKLLGALAKIASAQGAKLAHHEFKKSKTNEGVIVATFTVSDMQKEVVEQAIKSIMQSEEVGRGRALELMAAEYLAGAKQELPHEPSTRGKVQRKRGTDI